VSRALATFGFGQPTASGRARWIAREQRQGVFRAVACEHATDGLPLSNALQFTSVPVIA